MEPSLEENVGSGRYFLNWEMSPEKKTHCRSKTLRRQEMRDQCISGACGGVRHSSLQKAAPAQPPKAGMFEDFESILC